MSLVSMFDEYLKNFKSNTKITSDITHTRIGSADLKIYGGSYIIPDDKRSEFYERYYEHVFIKKRQEYLTEKQLIEDGPILVDLDLHYDPSVDTRLHSKEHIIDLIMQYAESISKLVDIESNVPIDVFIMEKQTVNVLDVKTKDGIHILIGIAMHKALQIMLREMIKDEIKTIWDELPIINTWDNVLDEGVCRGHSNWQLYGSRKPGHKAYELTGHYKIIYNKITDEWEIEEHEISEFNFKENFHLLSAQYNKHKSFEVKEEIKKEYEKKLDLFYKRNKKTLNSDTSNGKKKYNLKHVSSDDNDDSLNSDILDKKIEDLFTDINGSDYEMKEIHSYVMILPDTFYGPSSYDKWIRVGWALKNTNEKLFLSWVKMSSKSSEFSFDQVGDMYEKWQKFEYKNDDGLTSRSIIYWAKNNSSKEDYDRVRKETIEYFIQQSIQTSTEYDFATVLYNLFKDMFVCASIKGNMWYQYKGHKWEKVDSGNSLRLLISKDVHDIYCSKCSEEINKLHQTEKTDEYHEILRKKTNKLADICVLLKKTSWKNNIMRESQELFFDGEFINKLDQNPYLMCFNNGVVDFKSGVFRRGQPDDYLSMSTNIDYVQINHNKQFKELSDDIDDFMNQLFPSIELRQYMWDHLASCLIGTNDNQTFNIYTGSGANGKSKLVDLMSKLMGDYKGVVPLQLITQKRTTIGSTSSEIVQLKGKRYAVMQEPSKGDSINEGIMKEITGGDTIQGRALWSDSITFIPQFKLVVTTNTMFDIKNNDDGTWRRIRVCDFESKFLENPYEDEIKFPKDLYPYQYVVDKRLDSKFNTWAPIMMSKLVELAFKTKGNVKDCRKVLSASDEYRNSQDYLSQFTKDKIMKIPGGKIKKTELTETFKQWYTSNYGRSVPKGREIHDFMDKRYGAYKNGWNNISIIYDEEGDITTGDL
jgi:P4 family phage/plasmid primase-like protien